MMLKIKFMDMKNGIRWHHELPICIIPNKEIYKTNFVLKFNINMA